MRKLIAYPGLEINFMRASMEKHGQGELTGGGFSPLERLLRLLSTMLKLVMYTMIFTCLSLCILTPEVFLRLLNLTGLELLARVIGATLLGATASALTLDLNISLFMGPERFKKLEGELERYRKSYGELHQAYENVREELNGCRRDLQLYYNLYNACGNQIQQLKSENDLLQHQLRESSNLIENLRRERNVLLAEIQRIRDELNPPLAQVVSLYNDLVRKVSVSRGHLDTTVIDKLLIVAQKHLEEGNTRKASSILEQVNNLLSDEEILSRLRRLYVIGFASRYSPKPL